MIGTFLHEPPESYGEGITGVGVSAIKYVFASDKVEAKRKSNKKLSNDLADFPGASEVLIELKSIGEVPFWAIWSKQKYFYWRLDDPNQKKSKIDTINRVQKFHRYIP
jgi:uncharacterized membrane protein